MVLTSPEFEEVSPEMKVTAISSWMNAGRKDGADDQNDRLEHLEEIICDLDLRKIDPKFVVWFYGQDNEINRHAESR